MKPEEEMRAFLTTIKKECCDISIQFWIIKWILVEDKEYEIFKECTRLLQILVIFVWT